MCLRATVAEGRRLGQRRRSSHSRRNLTSGFCTPTGPAAPLQPGLNDGRVHLAVVANRPLHRDRRGQVVELIGATGGLRQQSALLEVGEDSCQSVRPSRARRGLVQSCGRPPPASARVRGPSAFCGAGRLCRKGMCPLATIVSEGRSITRSITGQGTPWAVGAQPSDLRGCLSDLVSEGGHRRFPHQLLVPH